MYREYALEGLTLQQLRYFVAVADGETFAGAADRFAISQSALSQGIARLEQVAAMRLLERAGRRRRLTDAGEAVAAYARRVISESEDLAEELRAQQSGTRGRLRVGMIDAAPLYLLTESLREFRRAHGDASISITVATSGALEQRLADFADDVSVVIGPAGRGDSLILLEEPMHLYGEGSIHDQSTFALYPTGSRTRRAVDAGLAVAEIVPQIAGESGNPAVLHELARLTGSFTVLPAGVVPTVAPLPRVVEGIAVRSVELVTRDRGSLSPLAAAFVKEMIP